MKLETLQTPAEQFTIGIDDAGGAARLIVESDRVRWVLPMRADTTRGKQPGRRIGAGAFTQLGLRQD